MWEKNSEKKYYYKFINYDTNISTLTWNIYSDAFMSNYFTDTYVNDKNQDNVYDYKIVKLEVTDWIITNVITKFADNCTFFVDNSTGTQTWWPQQATLSTHDEWKTVVHIKIPKIMWWWTSFKPWTTFQCTTSRWESVKVTSDIISVNNNYSYDKVISTSTGYSCNLINYYHKKVSGSYSIWYDRLEKTTIYTDTYESWKTGKRTWTTETMFAWHSNVTWAPLNVEDICIAKSNGAVSYTTASNSYWCDRSYYSPVISTHASSEIQTPTLSISCPASNTTSNTTNNNESNTSQNSTISSSGSSCHETCYSEERDFYGNGSLEEGCGRPDRTELGHGEYMWCATCCL